MKIDFYDLFSLHTPEEFPEGGDGNCITAAVKSRVAEQISVKKCKTVRVGRIGRIFLSAAAAAVILVTGTLAASALGFIDLERIFGSRFNGGFENMENISAVPQNVVTTGDDRLSMSVLGMAGTYNEAIVTVEVRRNDGGTFSENIILDDVNVECEGLAVFCKETIPVFSDGTSAVFCFTLDGLSGGKIAGSDCKITITDIKDYTDYTIKDVIIEGEWSAAFTLDYNSEYRTLETDNIKAAEGFVITEIGYSSISLDVYFDGFITQFDETERGLLENISINLDSGEIVALNKDRGYGTYKDPNENYTALSYSFEKPVDIDSIESITIGNAVIPVK
ncbi:MAG: hypothetical protein NC253_10565 [Ruminococcus sp.]|nr:hypothetical protein [Ruminococcus sp.]MCM1382831.1 hypothetical protein [Muribaculaceae bacterium]MCM1479341.1 hypothetical protein [Muribaculaceae bacterium]